LLEGNHRLDGYDYPDNEWVYYQMAERFGWTPAQVDDLPAYLSDWLLAIAGTIEQVKADGMRAE
jgi:cobalamin biosynthesis protein CobD/CbiB